MELSERLQQLRKKENYSQEKLAELLGISRQAVSKWESGQGCPDIDNIIKLTKIYHVSADYLLLGKDFDTPDESVQKERLISRKAIDIIAIIAALALSTVLLIAGLSIVEKLL